MIPWAPGGSGGKPGGPLPGVDPRIPVEPGAVFRHELENLMGSHPKLKHELKAVAGAMLFFGVWIGALILIKTLVLAEYHVGFSGWSKILVGALILSKVVLADVSGHTHHRHG